MTSEASLDSTRLRERWGSGRGAPLPYIPIFLAAKVYLSSTLIRKLDELGECVSLRACVGGRRPRARASGSWHRILGCRGSRTLKSADTFVGFPVTFLTLF